MALESIIVAAIVALFLVFAGTLIWVLWYTGEKSPAGEQADAPVKQADPARQRS